MRLHSFQGVPILSFRRLENCRNTLFFGLTAIMNLPYFTRQ